MSGSRVPSAVPADESGALARAVEEAIVALQSPGDWMTGAQRLAVWNQARGAATPRSGEGALPAPIVEVARQVAFAPGDLTRPWAEQQIAALGGHAEAEGSYVEAVGVVASGIAIDRFAVAVGDEPAELGPPIGGEPARVRPVDVGDVGAWVAQTIDKTRANVSRSLSLVPVTNRGWQKLVDPFYSRGAEFASLRWNRALSRPQVELVAARTTSLHECFY